MNKEQTNDIKKGTGDGLTPSILESIGGSSTHVVINFHLIAADGAVFDIPVYIGSMITISHSAYRSKASVYNCGSNLIDGFAIGNKYVAGTIIKGVFTDDDFNSVLNTIRDGIISGLDTSKITTLGSQKTISSLMKDDLMSCDINIIYTNEYTGVSKYEVIYDATFINSGQVASINDIITETTVSYIAKEIKTMDDISTPSAFASNKQHTRTATDLLLGK